MRYGSVCSGIEAASVAWHPLGWKAAFVSEIEPFPCAVLAHHYPDTPNHGDMTKFKEWPDAAIDVLVGGTPCQSFSVAGLRAGLDDPRGNLMLTFGAVAARYRPEWIVWENVPGVLSSNGGRDFGSFLGLLGQLGYGFAYRVLDAQFVRVDGFGRAVPQRRRRVFVVGCLGDWRRAAAVLFERQSLSGHPAPRRKAGESVAPTIAGCANGGGANGPGRDVDSVERLIPERARALTTSNQRIDAETETLLVTHALTGEGFDASEDGTGRGTPLVPVGVDCYNGAIDGAATHTLRAGNGNENGGVPAALVPVAFMADDYKEGTFAECDTARPLTTSADRTRAAPVVAFSCKDHGADAGEIAPTLRSMGHDGSHANGGGQVAVAFVQGEIDGRMDGGTQEGSSDLPAGSVRAVRRRQGRGSPQERGLAGPQPGEPAEAVPQLPHEGAPLGQAVPVVREAAQGAGLLRDALPEAEEARRPDGSWMADPDEVLTAGVPRHEPRARALQQTCTTDAQRDAREASVEQKRAREEAMGGRAFQVRRLTPTECARLQGFPDDYLDIQFRGKPASDSVKYKALGNSMAVNCMRWIGARIQMVEAIEKARAAA